MCSPIWKLFIAPCITETDEGFEYDAEKLVQFQADIKSGKRSICKEKKAQGGSGGGSAASKVQAFIDWFNAMSDDNKAKFKKSPDGKRIIKLLS